MRWRVMEGGVPFAICLNDVKDKGRVKRKEIKRDNLLVFIIKYPSWLSAVIVFIKNM